MKTTHSFIIGDSRQVLQDVERHSVDLVVTSPPYPMIEMWDECFEAMEPKIAEAGYNEAFHLMHNQLERVWASLFNILKPGGIVCINMGNAYVSTKNWDIDFRVAQNKEETVSRMSKLNFRYLPSVKWRKQTNSPNSFLGSGMMPPNAYVKGETEDILIFKKPGSSSLSAQNRRRSAYFFEERNKWFSDLWTDVKGVSQEIEADIRDRSGAFPIEIPWRLINMYSTYGDTVLDPFAGVGTTSVASLASGRNSISIDLSEEFAEFWEERLIEESVERSFQIISNRYSSHMDWVSDQPNVNVENNHHGFPVKTEQEKNIQLMMPVSVEMQDGGDISAEYEQYNPNIAAEDYHFKFTKTNSVIS